MNLALAQMASEGERRLSGSQQVSVTTCTLQRRLGNTCLEGGGTLAASYQCLPPSSPQVVQVLLPQPEGPVTMNWESPGLSPPVTHRQNRDRWTKPSALKKKSDAEKLLVC